MSSQSRIRRPMKTNPRRRRRATTTTKLSEKRRTNRRRFARKTKQVQLLVRRMIVQLDRPKKICRRFRTPTKFRIRAGEKVAIRRANLRRRIVESANRRGTTAAAGPAADRREVEVEKKKKERKKKRKKEKIAAAEKNRDRPADRRNATEIRTGVRIRAKEIRDAIGVAVAADLAGPDRDRDHMNGAGPDRDRIRRVGEGKLRRRR